MLRITLEGEDAEKYIQWRNRNGELAQENLSLRGEVAKLKSQLEKTNKQPKIQLVCDPDGNLLDVSTDDKPKRKSWFG